MPDGDSSYGSSFEDIMGNFRYRSQFQYSFAGQPVNIFAQVSIGASGAPTLVSNTGMGISSIVRNSAGKYTITFTNTFATLLDFNVGFISGASAPAAPGVNIVTNGVTVAAAPIIAFQCRNSSGVATDPASGEVLLIQTQMDRSSVGN